MADNLHVLFKLTGLAPVKNILAVCSSAQAAIERLTDAYMQNDPKTMDIVYGGETFPFSPSGVKYGLRTKGSVEIQSRLAGESAEYFMIQKVKGE